MPYKDKKQYQVYQAKYRKEHAAEFQEYFRKRYANGRERAYAQKTFRKYGILLDDYEKMLATQKGHCAICPRKPLKKRLNIDHNHKTGKVRGLLCFPCNYAVGMLGDSAQRAHALALYLEKHAS